CAAEGGTWGDFDYW
nr:immunoglobulin heavy chain junction region [Macaca mulatta]